MAELLGRRCRSPHQHIYLFCLQSVGQVGVRLAEPEARLCPFAAEAVGCISKQQLPQPLGGGKRRAVVSSLHIPCRGPVTPAGPRDAGSVRVIKPPSGSQLNQICLPSLAVSLGFINRHFQHRQSSGGRRVPLTGTGRFSDACLVPQPSPRPPLGHEALELLTKVVPRWLGIGLVWEGTGGDAGAGDPSAITPRAPELLVTAPVTSAPRTRYWGQSRNISLI